MARGQKTGRRMEEGSRKGEKEGRETKKKGMGY